MGRGGLGKHLKVSGLHSRGLGKGSARKKNSYIAIECYTSCTVFAMVHYSISTSRPCRCNLFCNFFSCLNTQCKQGQQNKVLKNFCVCPVCVCGGGGGGGGEAPPLDPPLSRVVYTSQMGPHFQFLL